MSSRTLIARTALSPRQTDTTQMFGLLHITQLTKVLIVSRKTDCKTLPGELSTLEKEKN